MATRLFPFLLGLPFIGLSAFNFAHILSGTPAFDASARATGILGNWRAPVATANFNQAEYLFQLGYGFIQSDALVSGVTEARDEIATPETMEERAASASLLLEASVALAPGNADAWSALAWAEALGGDLESARNAMEASWTLAPYNLDLATSRVSFYALLAETQAIEGTNSFTTTETLGTERDLSTMALQAPRLFALSLKNSEALAPLANTAAGGRPSP